MTIGLINNRGCDSGSEYHINDLESSLDLDNENEPKIYDYIF